MINSRSLDDLTPEAHMYAMRFLHACTLKGINILITCTYRDNEYQDYLYAQGRTRPGKIVTNAKGGESAHNYKVAFDFCPLVGGKPDWNDTKLWKEIGAIGQSVGLDWGGSWKSFPDMPHMQVPGFKIPRK